MYKRFWGRLLKQWTAPQSFIHYIELQTDNVFSWEGGSFRAQTCLNFANPFRSTQVILRTTVVDDSVQMNKVLLISWLYNRRVFPFGPFCFLVVYKFYQLPAKLISFVYIFKAPLRIGPKTCTKTCFLYISVLSLSLECNWETHSRQLLLYSHANYELN